MTPAELEFLGSLVRQRSGIVVGADKQYLLEARLAPIAVDHKLQGLTGLVAALRRPENEALAREVVEAMTTNETLFFRDSRPFEVFRGEVLPELMNARASSRSLRIWSAACSTGQEPYSIAMLLKEESPRLAGWRVGILGTDIARTVLAKARAGIYSQFEVQRGLPIAFLLKYFRQIGSQWELEPAVRAMVEFREHNLVRDPAPWTGFDVVFCRNLLIYFDQDQKRRVLETVAAAMAADAVLFLGGTESVLGITDTLAPIPEWRGAYRRVDRPLAAARRVAGGRI
jgi:chemotaxis protein methyltransferase CheR